MNFCATFMVLSISAAIGNFTPKMLPTRDRWLLALSAVCTVLSNNASVEANSVGTYQMAKLMIVPCIIVLERLQGIKRTYTPMMYFTLVLIATGVGMATVTDIELGRRGIAIALISMVLTAHYQIWQGSKQHEHGLTPQQITHCVMIPQIAISLPASILLDVLAPALKGLMLLPTAGMLETEADGSLRILSGPGGAPEICLNLLANSALSVGINLTTYYLIGATSPVTYQVVGQLKTILVIFFGYMLFDVPPPPGTFAIRLAGIAVAIAGVFTYGYLKTKLMAAEKAAAASKSK